METDNLSVFQPGAVRQASYRFCHDDRDEIKRRAEADFLTLYMAHGGRHRGKALHCIFHEDRTPSASIHKGRFRCFTCNFSLDPIEFVQRAQRTDFKNALAYLGEHYGVPVQSWRLPPAQRAKYAQQQRDIERDLPDALRWRRAAIHATDIHLDELKAPFADPKLGPTNWDEIPRVEQDLARLRRLTGAVLVEEYKGCRQRNPELTSAMVRAVAVLEHIEKRALEAYWDSMDANAK